LKLEAWAKKNAPRSTSESQPAQANYCRSIYSDHSGSKRPNGFERILAHRIGCQRARPSCPAERLTNNLMSIRGHHRTVNTPFVISTYFSAVHRPEAAALAPPRVLVSSAPLDIHRSLLCPMAKFPNHPDRSQLEILR